MVGERSEQWDQWLASTTIPCITLTNMPKPEPRCDRECTPCDSVDALLTSWAEQRPDLEMKPVGVVSRLSRVRDFIDAQLAAVFGNFGLTTPSFAVLVTLARLGGESAGVSQRRLADELGLTPGTVSVRIDRLSEDGLVSRVPDPDARRNVLVALTPKGRELFERAVPAHLANEARLLSALTEDEQKLLADLLRKLLVEFEGSAPPAPDGGRLGLLLVPAHVTIEMRASVGLPRVPGLLVRAVEPGSAAEAAGILPADVLIEADGRELRSSSSLYAAIEDAGQRLRLRLLRGDQENVVRVALDPQHPISGRAAASPDTGARGAHAV
jgi:DNA-binding MarR family transcriptional regulator